MIALAAHYSQPPEWRWYILGYFVLAGLAGGTYAVGTMLRLWGRAEDESAARLCFLLSLPLLVLCPLLLTLDLGHPLRFWHMLIDAGAAGGGVVFKWWSPMSLGAWMLLVFGVFVALTFLEVVALDGRYPYPLSRQVAAVLGGAAGRVVNVVGTVLAVFVAGYTGVLLSVSNQPVWSDTYALGGLFLASGLSGATALVMLAMRWRPGAAASLEALAEGDRLFALLELALIAVTLATLAFAGQLGRAVGFPWFVLWVVAVAGLLPALSGPLGTRLEARPGGAAVLARAGVSPAVASAAVLVGMVALRAAVLWSAQS
jgi:formate-dependent nitrite reductase membrane component NrfD